MKIFNINPGAKVRKSAFDLSHERKLTAEIGKLYPVFLQEAVPGDKWNIQTQQMIRLAPMLAPLYHRLNAYVHYFFVPMRLLWDGWEAFITNQSQSSLPTFEYPHEITVGSLHDHLGMPIGNFNVADRVNKLPFLAYYKIFNDYYRNQKLQTEIDLTTIDPSTEAPLLYRNWEKDYFTSCLPQAQQGDPVTMQANVVYKDTGELYDKDGNVATPSTDVVAGATVGGITPLQIDIERGNLRNIDEVTLDVEELRQANRLQRWLERNNRSGNRYVESLLAHFGVVSPDARLQRAEYIGGGKSPVVISEVLNMEGATMPQGWPTGHGINVGQMNVAHKYVQEHGYIMAIMSVTPEPNYMQGVPKLFDRITPLDFYWPEFAQLGEQEVKMRELWFDPTGLHNEDTFGYQSRYAEYKFIPSTVHGNFRSNLDYWHLARKFANMPALNEEFVQCKPRTEDIFAVTYDKEHLWISLYHKVAAVRPMPFFNTPML